MFRIRRALEAAVFSACLWSSMSNAQNPPPALPDPATTTVDALGWMQGFPPPPDKLITFDNPAGSVYPRTRWTFSHVRETVPTRNVSVLAGCARCAFPGSCARYAQQVDGACSPAIAQS